MVRKISKNYSNSELRSLLKELISYLPVISVDSRVINKALDSDDESMEINNIEDLEGNEEDSDLNIENEDVLIIEHILCIYLCMADKNGEHENI